MRWCEHVLSVLTLMLAWMSVPDTYAGQWSSELPSDWNIKSEISSHKLRLHRRRAASSSTPSCFVLMFVAPWCSVCSTHITAFEEAADDVQQVVKSGVIDPPSVKFHFHVVDGNRDMLAETYSISRYPSMVADCGTFTIAAEGPGNASVQAYSRSSMTTWATQLLYPVRLLSTVDSVLESARQSLFSTSMILCNTTSTVPPPADDEHSSDAAWTVWAPHLKPVAKFKSPRLAASRGTRAKDGWTLQTLEMQARRHAPHERVFGVIKTPALCQRFDLKDGDLLLLHIDARSNADDGRTNESIWWQSGDYTDMSPSERAKLLLRRRPTTEWFQWAVGHWIPKPVVFSRKRYAFPCSPLCTEVWRCTQNAWTSSVYCDL